jgi:hypothetical protein
MSFLYLCPPDRRSPSDAEAAALQAVNKRKFRAGNIHDDIKAISEI